MRFADLSRVELASLAEQAVVVLPVGACEQHGPHLPVGTDHVIIERLALDAAAAVKNIPVVVTPTIPIGYSEHHLAYGATISVSVESLRRYLMDCCRSLIRSGFRRVFILNGHGGNLDLISDAAREVAVESGVPIASGSYWVIAWDELRALGAGTGSLLPGHAGAFETSLAAAIRPEWNISKPPAREVVARQPRESFYPPYRIEDPTVWQRNDGYTDSPAAADPELGRRYLEASVSAVARAFEDFHRATA